MALRAHRCMTLAAVVARPAHPARSARAAAEAADFPYYRILTGRPASGTTARRRDGRRATTSPSGTASTSATVPRPGSSAGVGSCRAATAGHDRDLPAALQRRARPAATTCPSARARDRVCDKKAARSSSTAAARDRHLRQHLLRAAPAAPRTLAPIERRGSATAEPDPSTARTGRPTGPRLRRAMAHLPGHACQTAAERSPSRAVLGASPARGHGRERTPSSSRRRGSRNAVEPISAGTHGASPVGDDRREDQRAGRTPNASSIRRHPLDPITRPGTAASRPACRTR